MSLWTPAIRRRWRRTRLWEHCRTCSLRDRLIMSITCIIIPKPWLYRRPKKSHRSRGTVARVLSARPRCTVRLRRRHPRYPMCLRGLLRILFCRRRRRSPDLWQVSGDLFYRVRKVKFLSRLGEIGWVSNGVASFTNLNIFSDIDSPKLIIRLFNWPLYIYTECFYAFVTPSKVNSAIQRTFRMIVGLI